MTCVRQICWEPGAQDNWGQEHFCGRVPLYARHTGPPAWHGGQCAGHLTRTRIPALQCCLRYADHTQLASCLDIMRRGLVPLASSHGRTCIARLMRRAEKRKWLWAILVVVQRQGRQGSSSSSSRRTKLPRPCPMSNSAIWHGTGLPCTLSGGEFKLAFMGSKVYS